MRRRRHIIGTLAIAALLLPVLFLRYGLAGWAVRCAVGISITSAYISLLRVVLKGMNPSKNAH
jgi:hypothetical protein